MSAAFAAMLQPLYARLGVAAQYTPVGGGAAQARQVVLDTAGASALDGFVTQEPSLRAIAADFPTGIAKDSVFSVAEADYVVRSTSPIAPDGAELRVTLARLG
jgi:hypothetical protein